MTDGRPTADGGYRRVLWIALVVNLAMCAIEVTTGVTAHSVALRADALDFLGDAANYALGLWALRLGVASRARTSLLKAAAMAAFGGWVLLIALQQWQVGAVPSPSPMGLVGMLALAANVGVALLLYRHRGGDSNRRSVWLCTRNDAVGNLAVVLAALAVAVTSSVWPDLAVAVAMAGLALTSALQVVRHARGELRRGNEAA